MKSKGRKDLAPNHLVMEALILYKGLTLLKDYIDRWRYKISFTSQFMFKGCYFSYFAWFLVLWKGEKEAKKDFGGSC